MDRITNRKGAKRPAASRNIMGEDSSRAVMLTKVPIYQELAMISPTCGIRRSGPPTHRPHRAVAITRLLAVSW